MASIPVGEILSFLCDGWSRWWQSNSTEADGQEFIIQVVITLSVFVFAITTYRLLSKRATTTKEDLLLPLPPGPRGLPLVGNLPFLKPDLHIYFSELSETYGPIFRLQLGKKLCVVVSSSSLAKEIFKDHDAIFANHNPPIAALVTAYDGNDIVWNPHGPEWRMMRKVLVREMMSKKSLDASYNLRRQEIQKMHREVYSNIGTPVDIGNLIFVTLLDMTMNMLWGGAIKSKEKDSVGVEFRKMIGEIIVLIAKTNVSDLFPILARFDFQGIERKAKEVALWVDSILDKVINERLKMEALQEKKPSKDDLGSRDFLEILLELNKKQGDGKEVLSMKQLKALLLDIVVGGTDTTTTTLEWTFAEMMQNPSLMRKAQEELEQVVGLTNTVEESHISKLPYLNAVIKETHRLHPVLPLLVPHSPSQSCTVGQFTIPKGANVFLNIWKIHRDPEAWRSPSEFLPERFLRDEKEYDYMGNNFSYLPFGSGRRICAGISLAERMSTYMLASLLHSFAWKLPENVELDLSDEFGIMLKKKKPLLIIPTPRLSHAELYN